MRILVTGGGGFLGSGLVRRLLERGEEIAVLGRRNYPHLGPEVEQIRADILDRDAVAHAIEGRDVVYHTAALPGIWGDPKLFYGINVEGTRNVIEACRTHSVMKLVYTSSPSVVYAGSDMENVDESAPYPSSYLCEYPRTKAIAERLVLDANGEKGLSTVSLRPHLIWGPGDPHLVPRILDRARRGRLVRVGPGTNKVDIIYIDNAVEGHLRACEVLESGSPVAGNCYFLSDGRPVVLWDWIDNLLKAMGISPVKRAISYRKASRVGGILEWVYSMFGIQVEPPMTRFLASQLAFSHYFNISRARKDFGYSPVVDQEEGMKRLIQSLQSRPEY